ncbi:MAG: hypothetical protein P4L74_06630 [Candidatus Doudnabacteria bacterium]|nr:hypothetical protein [Candidatus Doudnabacteria bacterium]
MSNITSRSAGSPLGRPALKGGKKILSGLSAAVLSLGSLAGALTPAAFTLAAPATVNVTLVKYVDGQPATAQNTNSATFSMHVKYTGGEGDYLLGPVGVNTSNPYQIVETIPSDTNSYNTYENMYGAVGPTCASNLPYVLAGYSWGDSLAAAAAATPSMTMPNFTNLSSDEYVVVWNTSCGNVNPPPGDTTLHFVKVICPSYDDIAGNATADNLDATGGKFTKFSNYNASSTPHFPNPYVAKPVSTAEIPAGCAPASGWQFKISTDQTQTQDVTTTASTGSNGEVDVTSGSLTSNQQAALSGGGLWVSEVPQSGNAAFGALRCYNDANNGDNLENINFSGGAPTNAYCIAYNVMAPPPPQNVTVAAYKVICKNVSDLPDWGTANNSSRPSQMTPAVIANFVANSHGDCSYANNWNFQYGGPNVKPRGGNFIGPAGGAWKNFDTGTGGTSSTPATLTLGTSSLPSLLWVRENLQKGYIHFTDADGTAPHPNTRSAELFCNTDGLNYDNYDAVTGPLVAGTTYYCAAINVLKNGTKNGDNDKDGDDNGYYHINFLTMPDLSKGIKNMFNFGWNH